MFAEERLQPVTKFVNSQKLKQAKKLCEIFALRTNKTKANVGLRDVFATVAANTIRYLKYA